MKQIFDPIHQFIDLEDDEIRLIDSKYFQRLRHIHQLLNLA
jgi:HD superfamily phosphohydrolase